MLSENPGGESTTIRQNKVSNTHNAVSRCPAAEHDFQTTPFRQSDNFSNLGLFTRNSRFIQRHLCSHRRMIGRQGPSFSESPCKPKQR